MHRSFLCLFLSGALAGCSSDSDPDAPNSQPTTDGPNATAGLDGAGGADDPSSGDSLVGAEPERSWRTLDEGVDGGPVFADDPEEAGLHLRRFVAHADAEEARVALAALDWSDGADRSALADILEAEGGTLLGLYPGRQSSQGAVGTSVRDVAVEGDRLVVALRTTTDAGCDADSAFGTPFRVVLVGAEARETLFREAIVPCEEAGAAVPDRVRDVAVEFTGDSSATITWSAPAATGEGVRYDVVSRDGERGADVYDGVDAGRYEVDGLVPGLVRAYRIVPVDPSSGESFTGVDVALVVDAPSALFAGRVRREDFEARARALAGPNAIDCGDGGPAASSAEPKASTGCAERALANGEAFVRTWTLPSEGEAAIALAANGDGDAWLLDFDLPDAGDFEAAFAPIADPGGRLLGRPCPVPLLDDAAGEVRCAGG